MISVLDELQLNGQGHLRLAAWRAVWGAQRANPVYYQHLTSRDTHATDPAPNAA
jgi:transposase